MEEPQPEPGEEQGGQAGEERRRNVPGEERVESPLGGVTVCHFSCSRCVTRLCGEDV